MIGIGGEGLKRWGLRRLAGRGLRSGRNTYGLAIISRSLSWGSMRLPRMFISEMGVFVMGSTFSHGLTRMKHGSIGLIK